MSSLSTNTQDRKARLAALKNLKRKQPTADDDEDQQPTSILETPSGEEQQDETPSTTLHLSGRNYDPQTRAPKLGFESDPSLSTKETLESRARTLATTTKALAEEDAKSDAPLDLFKLQPKKQNWDLKRDLERKLEVLSVRTDNAVARLVRERIGERQRVGRERAGVEGNGGKVDGKVEGAEVLGMEGEELIEATHLREKEDEEDARREREADEELLDGS